MSSEEILKESDDENNRSTDLLLNIKDNISSESSDSEYSEEDTEIYALDTTSFIQKYDANSKNLRVRKSKIIAKRLHMESICVVSKLHNLPWYKYIEYGLICIFLVPFRIFAAGLPVVFAFFIIKAATLFENLNKKYINNPESEHYGKPVHRIPKSKWRRKIIEFVTRLASKITLVFGLGFYDIKVTDLRKKDENGKPITAPLIIANHSSLVDVLAIFAYYDSCPSFLAMNWVKKTPFVSGVADGLQCIYVEPDRKQGLTKQIQARVEESAKYDLPPFTIFPEGTTTNGTRLIDFKYGAFYPHVPVQPIAIKYNYKYYNPSYVIDEGLKYVLKTAMQFKNELELVFLPVVYPETEAEKTDVKVWTEKNYQILGKELNIPFDRICTRPQKMFYLNYVRGKWDFERTEKAINEIYIKRVEALNEGGRSYWSSYSSLPSSSELPSTSAQPQLQPQPPQEQKQEQEPPKQEQPQQEQEQPKQDQEQPQQEQEQPKQEQQEQPQQEQEQPQQEQEQPQQEQEQPKQEQEQPPQEQEQPKQEQEQPPQEQQQ